MADINKLIPFLLKWEGGYVENPDDSGGPTNRGVTLKTWQKVGYDKNEDGVIDEEDLKLLFRNDLVECVLRPHYWNRWQADKIRNQSVANLLVDWLWMSGIVGIKTPQSLLNLPPDGVVGEKTLAAVNRYPDPKELFERIRSERVAYIERICDLRPTNRRFKKGWLNRLNDLKFAFVAMMCFLSIAFFSSCRSVASAGSLRAETEIVSNSEKESDREINTRRDAVLSKQFDSAEDTETIIETVTVRFDTASSDSISEKHPIKEITKTSILSGKAIRSSGRETQVKHRTDSLVLRNRETADQKATENIRTREINISNPYHRLYAAGALILLLIGIGLLTKKYLLPYLMPKK